MHVHASQASALGNSLAGAQAAETAMSVRRARELRDAATRLKAIAMEVSPSLNTQPQTVASTDSRAVNRVASQAGPSGDQAADPQTVQMIAAWTGGYGAALAQMSGANPGDAPDSADGTPNREVQPSPPAQPVSYWA